VKLFPRFVVGLLLALLTACGERPESKEPRQIRSEVVKKEALNPALAATAYEKQQKEEYQTRLEAILNGYLDRIEALKAKAGKSVTAPKENWQDVITALEVKTEALSSILNKLKGASLESWHELKPDIHAALDDLESSYDKAGLALKGSSEQPSAAGKPVPEGVIAVRTMAESN
jgi:hypothetical protein